MTTLWFSGHIAGRSQLFLHLHGPRGFRSVEFLGISGFHRKQMEVKPKKLGAPQFSSISRWIFPLFSHPASIGDTIHGHLHVVVSTALSGDFPAKFHVPRVKQMTTSFGLDGSVDLVDLVNLVSPDAVDSRF